MVINVASFGAVARDLASAIAEAVDRWLMNQHMPREDGTCPTHWRPTDWPCRDFDEAAERRQDRRRQHTPRQLGRWS